MLIPVTEVIFFQLCILGIYLWFAYTNKLGNLSVVAGVCMTAVRKPQFIEPLKNTSVAEGRSVVLRCTFTGEPPPQIQWLRNDAQILPSAVFKVGQPRHGYFY